MQVESTIAGRLHPSSRRSSAGACWKGACQDAAGSRLAHLRRFYLTPSVDSWPESALKNKPLSTCPACTPYIRRQLSDCRYNHVFDLSTDYDSTEWIEPGRNEGPVNYKKKGSFCSDCSGCFSSFQTCPRDVRDSKCPAVLEFGLGGYFAVEFARDRVLQDLAPDGPKTTQEVVAAFLSQTWSSSTTTSSTSHPYNSAICFIGTGFHDVAIEGITLEAYLENVEWYLDLLRPVCSKYVWMYNTAPLSDDTNHPQKIGQTFEWNEAVGRLLRTPKYKSVSSIIDVFDASKSWSHSDNIHMTRDWYESLGKTLLAARSYTNSRTNGGDLLDLNLDDMAHLPSVD
mmetsp:Transcript_16667/g.47841  ORF Transcript_16667/g.47841 Transcript_16667/m.47841 type:complete len:342 (-) Transcript_16667:2-1027(-)